MKTLRVGVLAALAVGALACRDLGLPSQEADGGVVLVGGTELTLLAPDVAQVQPQVTTVRVRLRDVNGLRAATLGCGDAVLASWLAGGETERELERRVDLAPCRPGGLEAGGVGAVELVVQSVDATGVQQVHGPFRLQALFTARGSEDVPVELAVDVPERVAPLAPVTLRLHASTPLTALPAVSVDGRAALVQAEAADAGLADTWVAELPGGVPLAVPTSDAPPDISVSERVVLVQVTARSPGGVATQVSVPLTVSRVLWERYLPAGVYVGTETAQDRWAIRPVPTPEGLVLPVQRTGDSSSWLPVLVEARTGAVQRLPTEVTDRGWVALGLTAAGRALLLDPKTWSAELRGVTTPADAGVPLLMTDQSFDGLLPVGDRLCRPHASATWTPDGGFCATPAELALDCVEADGTNTRVTVPGPVGADGQSGYQYASGEAVLTLPLDGSSTGCCRDCPTSALVGTPGGLTHVKDFRGGQLTEDFARILPDGAGGFALVLHQMPQLASASPGPTLAAARGPLPVSDAIVRAYAVHGDGMVGADVTGVAGRDTAHLLGLVPGDVLVSVAGGTQSTWVEGWKPLAQEPTWVQELPGSLLPYYTWNADRDERNRSLFFADGSGVALMRRDGFYDDAVVVGFGPGLQPAWVFYVPVPSYDVRLFLSPDGQQVYLADLYGSVVTALAR